MLRRVLADLPPNKAKALGPPKSASAIPARGPSAKTPMRTPVIIIAFVVGSWLAFDGIHALTKGDYVTTRTGELGPWARIVSRVGIGPRSNAMKLAHVVLGIAWLTAMALHLARVPGARPALLCCSVLTLWYLPLGTMLSTAEIVLLIISSLRGPE